MLDRDICILRNYIDRYFLDPNQEGCKSELMTSTYQRWAANEILDRMMCEASKLPPHISGVEPLSTVEIIKNFIDEVEWYSETCLNLDHLFIFDTAAKEAKNILGLFI